MYIVIVLALPTYKWWNVKKNGLNKKGVYQTVIKTIPFRWELENTICNMMIETFPIASIVVGMITNESVKSEINNIRYLYYYNIIVFWQSCWSVSIIFFQTTATVFWNSVRKNHSQVGNSIAVHIAVEGIIIMLCACYCISTARQLPKRLLFVFLFIHLPVVVTALRWHSCLFATAHETLRYNNIVIYHYEWPFVRTIF